MSVAVVLNDEKHAAQVFPWAVRLAQAGKTELLAIVVNRKPDRKKSKDKNKDDSNPNPEKGTSDSRWSEIDLGKLPEDAGSVEKAILVQTELLNLASPKPPADASEAAAPDAASDTATGFNLVVRQFTSSDPVVSLSAALAKLDISLLIIPKSIDDNSDRDVADWHELLYRQAPCRTMFLHDDKIRDSARLRVLSIVTDAPDDRAALKAGHQLAKSTDGELTAMFFEPAIDAWATQVGDRILDRIVRAELGRNSADVRQKTVLAESVTRGLSKLDPEEYDIIFFGCRQRREINKFMLAIPGGDNGDAPAMAAVRNKVPYASQLNNRVQNVIQRYVPQLTRPERITLFEKVQSSSQWDFDFVALISLSTMIAALGLIDNSIPVVIGAMLVAPLMTPIIAIGLGLAQSNLLLIKSSFRTVRHGFVTAFIIGILLGLAVFTFAMEPGATLEMQTRDLPGFIDLLVALVGGIAAAYALSRPNLSEAIPGVAIAAALVPPLATAGLSVALLDWKLAVGASLLFLTNVIAIVLGASITFWLVGVRTEKRDKQAEQWPRWLMLGLLIATFILTAILEIIHHPHWLSW